MKKDILVVLQNIIQYYSLEPLLDHIKRYTKFNFDIFVFNPEDSNDSGFKNISSELTDIIDSKKYNIISKSEVKKNHYKICLSPYQDMVRTNYDYLIGYYYGSASTKPNPTFLPEFKNSFHGVFLHSVYDAECLSVYSKTYIVPNLRLKSLPKNKKHINKKTLLYLPTYGKINDIEKVCKVLETIKKEFYIITKKHHGTDHLLSESNKKNILENISDECYSSKTDINKLFKKADLVLSDNSGAIFDAMYVGLPVCIVSKNMGTKLDQMIPLHEKLVQKKIIPFTNNITEKSLLKLFEKTLKKEIIKRQEKEAEILFPIREENGVKYWIRIIEDYINNNISDDYINLHNYYVSKQKDRERELNEKKYELKLAEDKNNELNLEIQKRDKIIYGYDNGKLYKIAKKIYKIKGKVLKNG